MSVLIQNLLSSCLVMIRLDCEGLFILQPCREKKNNVNKFLTITTMRQKKVVVCEKTNINFDENRVLDA